MSIELLSRKRAHIPIYNVDWVKSRCQELVPNRRLLFEGVLFAPDPISMTLTLDITKEEQALLKLTMPELVWAE